ncbi:MAG: hypothetical protein MOB07_23135 [Acidobacteria bacterium]|nr:hypothetical protein [Acidobacteriota bacterium]
MPLSKTEHKLIELAQSMWNVMKWFWLVFAVLLMDGVITKDRMAVIASLLGLGCWLIISGCAWLIAKMYPEHFEE